MILKKPGMENVISKNSYLYQECTLSSSLRSSAPCLDLCESGDVFNVFFLSFWHLDTFLKGQQGHISLYIVFITLKPFLNVRVSTALLRFERFVRPATNEFPSEEMGVML